MLVLIVTILGIIIAGGFLLYFLGDIVMGMSKKHSKDDEAIKQRQIEKSKKVQDRVDALGDPEKAKQDPTIAAVLMNGGKVEAYDPLAEELAAQKIEAQIEAEIAEEEITEEVEESEETEEKTETKEENAAVEEFEELEETEEEEEEEEEIDDVADYIAQRRKELMEKLAKIREENDDNNAMNLDEEDESDSEEAVEEEEAEADDAEEVEENTETAKPVIVVEGNLKELEDKLENLQERLKSNEKELRQCKKEFIPLKKVKNTLEKDEKKLRRKEALVAKQKVVLYGVNNYADIDEEKAKKLAEDLDLLDGLKLSVQHCHEVMENNKERYPLLEQVYNLLTARNEDIKAEIQEVQAQIDAIKNN